MAPPSDQVLAEGRFLRLVRRGRWEFADRHNSSGAVVIVAVTPDQRLLLVEQLRVPLEKRVIELPAGITGDSPDTRGEAPETAARRELIEETGYDAERFEVILSGPTSAGLSTEVVTLVRATGLRRVSEGGGVDQEQIVIHAPLLREARSWLFEQMAGGVLVDPKVFAGIYFSLPHAGAL